MMAENKRNSLKLVVEDRRVKELEDIICTLKFELNGLKHVVTSVESDARIEREMMRQGFQQRVDHVANWLDTMKGEVEKKAGQITELEEKVTMLAAKGTKQVVSPQHSPSIQLRKQQDNGVNIGSPCQQCLRHKTELQTQKEKIAALEKQLQAEIQSRQKAERECAEALAKYKENKPVKEKKPPANIGIPHKLILPEAPAPKFWLQTIQPCGNTEVLSLNDVLDGILRPFREDEIWALLHQVAGLLNNVHDSGKIHGNLSLDTIGSNRDGKISFIDVDEEAAPKYKPPTNVGADAIYDIFGLGVVLWSTSDYLLDDDEEPATSEALCILIGDMTSDEISEIPSIADLLLKSSSYAQVSQNLFREILRELERKKEMRNQYEKGITVNQGDLVKQLLTEIAVGIPLKKVPPPVDRHWKVDNSWQTTNAKMKLIRVA